jgi:hypothetical protein
VNKEEKKIAFLQISSAAALLIAGFGIYFYYHDRPLDKKSLKVLVGDLRSTASEADLLTDQIEQQKVKTTYSYEHLSLIIEAAKKTSEKLKQSKVQDELVSEKEITEKTAQELLAGLEKFQKESVASQDFEKLEKQLDQVEESLE